MEDKKKEDEVTEPHKKRQFTDMVDEDGVQIREGDILDNGNEKFVVRWNVNMNRWMDSTHWLPNTGTWCDLRRSETSNVAKYKKVIGNIYDNPELIVFPHCLDEYLASIK